MVNELALGLMSVVIQGKTSSSLVPGVIAPGPKEVLLPPLLLPFCWSSGFDAMFENAWAQTPESPLVPDTLKV